MASAALSGDLERLKDIFESDDCSIIIQRPGVGTLDSSRVSVACIFMCRDRVKQTPQFGILCCCGWRDEKRGGF